MTENNLLIFKYLAYIYNHILHYIIKKETETIFYNVFNKSNFKIEGMEKINKHTNIPLPKTLNSTSTR